MSDISVIGVGNMGAALASALLQDGRAVTVWNRTSEKATSLVDQGAILAPTLEAAIAASEATIVCVKSQATTNELLKPLSEKLKDKTIIDLSTGGAYDAKEQAELLNAVGAHWLIGMINSYPSGIGKEETSIFCAGPPEVWDRWCDTIRVLGGASKHIGTKATAAPGLLAGMGTARLGFMYGLIFGGAVCRKAGLPIGTFIEQIPTTLEMVGGYADLFERTVPNGDYDDPGATIEVYRDGLSDVLATFEETGTPDALPRLMRDLAQRGVDEGFAGQELTSLTEMLSGN
jgi:3-hydroxyisobutyrate dehydrogenase-like beta-hydroxyacid dehydrogenase